MSIDEKALQSAADSLAGHIYLAPANLKHLAKVAIEAYEAANTPNPSNSTGLESTNDQPDDLLQWAHAHYDADGPAADKTYWKSILSMLRQRNAAPDDCRAAFEKWYMMEGNIFNTIDRTPTGLNTDEIYCKPATRRAWAAFQAGLKARPERESVEVDAVAEVLYGAEMHGSWCWEYQRDESKKARPRKLAKALLEYFDIRRRGSDDA